MTIYFELSRLRTVTSFSTFREPGAMLRYIFGMLLAHLLYAAKPNHRRALNYSVFWLVLNVILLN